MGSVFDLPIDLLPAEIPIFPLPGALLMPRGQMPLNLFEPRYLNMADDALGAGRMIGMVQPLEFQPDPVPEDSALYTIGCAGRITAFAESDDGRLMITLKGVCRFNVAEELPGSNGYRRVRPDYAPYADDLSDEPAINLDREKLMTLLRSYFESSGIKVDWETIDKASDHYLVTSLAMMCPFGVGEKQAMLEAVTLTDTCNVLVSLMEMAVSSGGEAPATH